MLMIEIWDTMATTLRCGRLMIEIWNMMIAVATRPQSRHIPYLQLEGPGPINPCYSRKGEEEEEEEEQQQQQYILFIGIHAAAAVPFAFMYVNYVNICLFM